MADKATKPVIAEISEDGDRINVTFAYNPARVKAIKKVPSARFVPAEKGGPLWRVNLDLIIARRLRDEFGSDLGLGEKLIAWGHEEVAKERNLTDLSQAEDADLDIEDDKLFGGEGFRPYQRADVKFMSTTNVLNANQPGAGKTSEVIAALIEMGEAEGQHLVFAPVTSLRNVWEDEINGMYADLGLETTVLTGDTPADRRKAVEEAKALADKGEGFWLVLNPAMARVKTVRMLDGKALTKAQVKELPERDLSRSTLEEEPVAPLLEEISWTSITVDEFHLMGLSNPSTAGAKGTNRIAEVTQPKRRFALSGTPMGGKPIKLWGALHFLNPEEFTSMWNWARTWLVINHNGYGSNIEGITPGREVDFYDHLKPYLVRRTKKEALPGLPPKQIINVWATMTPRQREQYTHFATEAEWRMADAEEDERLTATNILAEYTRLKQFAMAFCEVRKTGKEVNGIPQLAVEPTEDSGKLPQLMEKLAEEGITDPDLDTCAVVASQFKGVVKMVTDHLNAQGIKAEMISGDVTGKERDRIVREFQEGGKDAPRVIVLNTLAGGTAITLDRADSVHILDETWVPDNQEQVEDRVHRASRMDHQVRIYYYRTKDSIEEYIQKMVAEKAMNNKTILDLRRRMQEAAKKARQEAAEKGLGE